MSGKTIFWACLAVYEIAVIVKFYILPALRRWELRKVARMSTAERRIYLKYINY